METEWYHTEAGVRERLQSIRTYFARPDDPVVLPWLIRSSRPGRTFNNLGSPDTETVIDMEQPTFDNSGLADLEITERHINCLSLQLLYSPKTLAYWSAGKGKSGAELRRIGRMVEVELERGWPGIVASSWGLRPISYRSNWTRPAEVLYVWLMYGTSPAGWGYQDRYYPGPETLVRMLRPEWQFQASWRTGDTVGLARTLYTTRGHGGQGPILADAMEEAGCYDVRILDYLRSGEKMFQGEWVLENLLGKCG